MECSDATGCGTGPAALSWDFQVCSQLVPSPFSLPAFSLCPFLPLCPFTPPTFSLHSSPLPPSLPPSLLSPPSFPLPPSPSLLPPPSSPLLYPPPGLYRDDPPLLHKQHHRHVPSNYLQPKCPLLADMGSRTEAHVDENRVLGERFVVGYIRITEYMNI